MTPKQLHHIMRLQDFITRYVTDEPYKDILIPKDKDTILFYKTTPVSLDKARELSSNTVEWAKKFKQDYMDNNPVKINREVDNLMNDVLTSVIKYSFRKELKDEQTNINFARRNLCQW